MDDGSRNAPDDNRSATVDFFHLQASFCRVFGDEKRLRIMWFLGKDERTVGEIARHLDVPMPNASQQLRVLRDKGAVTFRKNGQTVYYRIANEKFLVGSQMIREGLIEELRKKRLAT